MELLGILLIGVAIGAILGLTGSGGSVFALPLLMLIPGLPAHEAVAAALGAVSIAATVGLIAPWRAGTVLWAPALVFSCAGAVTAPLGKVVGTWLPASAIVGGFAILSLLVARRMWCEVGDAPVRASVPSAVDEMFACRFSSTGQFELRPRCLGGMVGGGLAVGLLSGLFGVGGGFLIIPLLIYLSGITVPRAIGTSLFCIAVISFVGFCAHLSSAAAPPKSLLAVLGAGGALGMGFGRLLSAQINVAALQKLFALALLAAVLFTVLKQFFYSV